MKQAFAALATALLCAAPLQAQPEYAPPVRIHAVSILPLHFLGGSCVADFERVLSSSVSIGAGAGYFRRSGTVETDPFTSEQFHSDDFHYRTLERKIRFYASGDVLNGLSFGVTAGPTYVTGEDVSPVGGDSFTATGLGLELARSHTMGADSRFYYGFGGGGK